MNGTNIRAAQGEKEVSGHESSNTRGASESLEDRTNLNRKEYERKIIEHSKAWQDHAKLHPPQNPPRLLLAKEKLQSQEQDDVQDHKPLDFSSPADDFPQEEEVLNWRCSCGKASFDVEEDGAVTATYDVKGPAVRSTTYGTPTHDTAAYAAPQQMPSGYTSAPKQKQTYANKPQKAVYKKQDKPYQ
ncbi:hypothetical protein D6783_05315 [Candidatus Woesearchaeota archaeon]|nr:MAG: hypothetical protein D6783_05315 [Candidatus Woesearchaeota archaeon]